MFQYCNSHDCRAHDFEEEEEEENQWPTGLQY